MRSILAAVLFSIPAVAASAQASVQATATVVGAEQTTPAIRTPDLLSPSTTTPSASTIGSTTARSSVLSSYRTDYGPAPRRAEGEPLEVVSTKSGSRFRKASLPPSASIHTDAA